MQHRHEAGHTEGVHRRGKGIAEYSIATYTIVEYYTAEYSTCRVECYESVAGLHYDSTLLRANPPLLTGNC